MTESEVAFFDHPAQMQPLVIEESRPVFASLRDLAQELTLASVRLDASLPKQTARGLADLVAGMNCYYSNLLEGHHTLPFDIANALQVTREAGRERDIQSLAAAHIEADRWARDNPLVPEQMLPYLTQIHGVFGGHLPEALQTLEDGTRMVAGEFRQRNVQVGRHLPPKWEALPVFLEQYAQTYGQRLKFAASGGASALNSIVAAVAAHHRLVWIHPFLDGNGRVARIMLDAMLRTCGVNQSGLWSMSRAFAKKSADYKARLAMADEPRHGDLDGRGNLSEKGLAEFCRFALQEGIDQATFMHSLFDLQHFKSRAYLYFEKIRSNMLRPESAHLYLQAFVMGEVDRGDAPRITGLKERTARDTLSALIAEGFLVSDTPKGAVRAAFPMHAMSYLLPNLYPYGDVDVSDAYLQSLHRKKQNP